MNLNKSYFIFQTKWPGLDQSAVLADINSNFNPKYSAVVDRAIRLKWDEKKRECSRLYDQTKFRLGGRVTRTGTFLVRSSTGPGRYLDFFYAGDLNIFSEKKI